jgi:DNA invertase Pin-like site-specific DNA recombinase
MTLPLWDLPTIPAHGFNARRRRRRDACVGRCIRDGAGSANVVLVRCGDDSGRASASAHPGCRTGGVVATAVDRGHRLVVRAVRSTDGSGWTLVYPAPTRHRPVATRHRSLDRPSPRGDPVPSGAGVLIGYARCSTDKQDLAAQRHTLRELGVSDDRVYLDHRMTGRHRKRPGLEQALAAVREGDTLVVPKLDRLARSVPDARAIGDSLAAGGVRLSVGGTVYDPNDPMGKMFFNILATFTEFEVDLLRMRTREGMAIARANGKLKGNSPNSALASVSTSSARPDTGPHHRRGCRALLGQPRDDLPRDRTSTPPTERPVKDGYSGRVSRARRPASRARRWEVRVGPRMLVAYAEQRSPKRSLASQRNRRRAAALGAYCGSAGLDAVVTAPVLAASVSSASTPRASV